MCIDAGARLPRNACGTDGKSVWTGAFSQRPGSVASCATSATPLLTFCQIAAYLYLEGEQLCRALFRHQHHSNLLKMFFAQ